jgi:hypothetical protein
VTIDDFERAEALRALRRRCARRVRRHNMGLCAVVIATVSLLGWAVIVLPLVGLLR